MVNLPPPGVRRFQCDLTSVLEPAARPYGPTWQGEVLARAGLSGRDWGALPVMDARDLRVAGAGASLVYFSSGSTGRPKRIAFSEEDWKWSVAHRAECLSALGVGSQHTAAVMMPFGPWFSGDHVSEALLSLGATVLPVGMYGPHMPGVLRLMAELQVRCLSR